jgi:diguanylate cyclase (GGDEF)-like protein
MVGSPNGATSMQGFDPRSFIITSAMLGIVCSFIFFVLRRSFPKEIGGLTEWAWGCLMFVAAAFLFASRGFLPPFLCIIVANIVVITGIALLYMGVRRFAGFPAANTRWGTSLLMLAAALIWLTLIHDDYRGRIELVTFTNMTLFLASAVVTLRIKHQGVPERFTAAIFLWTALVSFLRLAAAITHLDNPDYQNDNSLVHHLYLATFAFSLISLSLGFMLMVNKRLHAQLEYSACHDDLTGAYTRATFFELLTKEIGRSRRYFLPLSLLIIDIDDFKSVNDRFGHVAGDDVIKSFVMLARHQLRDHDVLCRYGGEEFTVILPATALAEASKVADRIRASFAGFALEGMPPFTVSIGVVSARNGSTEVKPFINAADNALYVAKKVGKNRVEVAPEINMDKLECAAQNGATRI